MKHQLSVFCISCLLSLIGACNIKPCDKSLRIGEMVQIPIQFNGFSTAEIDNIFVYRIDKSNANVVDTFRMPSILWANKARTTSEIITDRGGNFGYYGSYFHNCDLIFDWQTGRDTLANIEILKSQEVVKDCHKDDPNVRIDKLVFMHKGNTITKNQSIQITK